MIRGDCDTPRQLSWLFFHEVLHQLHAKLVATASNLVLRMKQGFQCSGVNTHAVLIPQHRDAVPFHAAGREIIGKGIERSNSLTGKENPRSLIAGSLAASKNNSECSS